MKKLICCLLCLFLLTSCGLSSKEDGRLEEIRQQTKNANTLLAVAYLGETEGDFDAVHTFITQQAYYTYYHFFAEIPEKCFAQNDGSELYCVVPAERDVNLSIHKAEFDETSARMIAGEELLSVTNTDALLLRGNISESMPNLMIVAKKGDITVEYTPCLSLKNGVLENEQKAVYDFSPYDVMERFLGEDAQTRWDFYGDWTCTVLEQNDSQVTMNLSIAPEGVEYSYIAGEVSGSLHGEFMVQSGGGIRLGVDGKVTYPGEQGPFTLDREMDAIFLWEVKDGKLLLTHTVGDYPYPNPTVTTYSFVPVSE